MGGRVDNHLRPVAIEYLFNTGFVGLSQMMASMGTLGKLFLSSPSMKKRGFSACSTNKSNLGLKAQTCRDISEPMEPPAPSYENNFIGEEGRNLVEVKLMTSREQVVDIDISHLGNPKLAGSDVRQRGNGAEPQLGALADLDDVPKLFAGGRGNGDGNFIDAEFLAEGRQ
jgi:hypothetical protein